MIKKTVIISCAGMGTRLGMDMPKCLVDLGNGITLLEMQLNQLKDVDDVRVVVGYKKELVIEKLKEINSNAKVYVNDNYMNTGTAGSFCEALKDETHDYVIALDGDLLVDPNDMKEVLNTDEEIICAEKINTEDPVLVTLDENDNVIKFSRESGTYEWAGLAQIRKDHIIKGDRHVYQLLEPLLPVKFKLIHAKEIDTPNDLIEARKWVSSNEALERYIMDNWFKSRFNIDNNYLASRHAINNRDDYDIELIKKYINESSKILDLGCGTGVLEERLEQDVSYIKAIDKYQEFLEKAKKSNKIEYEQHDVASYFDSNIYDLIMMFGVSIYLFDEELYSTINNCYNMMGDDSTFILKNQWSTSNEDYVVNKQYSDSNKNKYFGIYRSLNRMKKILEECKMQCEIVDIYPSDMNNYSNTHEYAFICKKLKK